MIGLRTQSKSASGGGEDHWVRRHALAICALTVLVVGLVLVIPVARSGAEPTVGELEGKLADARDEAGALRAEIQGQTQDLFAAEASAETARAREERLSATLAGGRERAARLGRMAETAQAELRDQRARLRRARQALAERLVAIYKAGTPDEISILLNAEGFDDMATRYEYLRRVEDADSALVSRVGDLAADFEARLADVSAAKQRVDAFNARLTRARDRIAAVRAAAESRAAALESAQAARESTLAELGERMDDWTEQIADAREASAADAADEVAGWTGGDWAIPAYIVMCESGGDYTALNPTSGAGGAYQILPSTWAAYGGEGLPNEAPPAEQDRIAALIWADSGPAAWACA